MIKNFSSAETLLPTEYWKKKEEDERIKIISNFLKSKILYKDFKVIKAFDNGNVIIRFDQLIPANKRGVFLLDLEDDLKKKIDKGIVIWCEPVGDKSKLRQLRGVTISS